MANVTSSTQVGAINVAATANAGRTTAVLAFSGAFTLAPLNATLGTTLLDGNYRLDILASQVKLAANNAATMPVDYVLGNQLRAAPNNDNFLRWYGYAIGDGFVDVIDLFDHFALSFFTGIGSANYSSDSDGNGDSFIDVIDLFDYFAPNFFTSRP